VRRIVLFCGLLALVAGCGSSASSSGSGSGSTQTTASTSGGNNRAAIQACLKKAGLSFPQRPGGNGQPPANGQPRAGAGGGFLFGGGGGPPGGRNAGSGDFAKIQAALKKCGINVQRRRSGSFNLAKNPRFKKALTSFVSCVRKNGYDLPAPNTSGNGPVFDASKVNRKDPKFQKAATKCQKYLQALRPQGAPDGQPPGTAS
jgi:hypothetical protein